jgi:hypothetical protein
MVGLRGVMVTLENSPGSGHIALALRLSLEWESIGESRGPGERRGGGSVESREKSTEGRGEDSRHGRRAKVRKDARVLPAYYSNQYFSLLPSERRVVRIGFDDSRAEQLRVRVAGWNVPAIAVSCVQPFADLPAQKIM